MPKSAKMRACPPQTSCLKIRGPGQREGLRLIGNGWRLAEKVGVEVGARGVKGAVKQGSGNRSSYTVSHPRRPAPSEGVLQKTLCHKCLDTQDIQDTLHIEYLEKR